MSCREVVETITDYFEDAMSTEERTRFEAHLASCADCAVYLAQMRQTIAALGEVREELLPRRTREELVASFRGWREERDR